MHIILLRTGGGTYGTVLHTVRGVGGLGIRMLTLDTKTSLYTEDRGLQVLMVLEQDYVPHTCKCFFRSHGLLVISSSKYFDNILLYLTQPAACTSPAASMLPRTQRPAPEDSRSRVSLVRSLSLITHPRECEGGREGGREGEIREKIYTKSVLLFTRPFACE